MPEYVGNCYKYKLIFLIAKKRNNALKITCTRLLQAYYIIIKYVKQEEFEPNRVKVYSSAYRRQRKKMLSYVGLIGGVA